MGAESSAQRDGKSQEDAPASASASASAGELSAEVNALQEGSSVLDSKVKPIFLIPVTVDLTDQREIMSCMFI